MHGTRLLYNSDSYNAFEHKKNMLLCALVKRDCYYLPPLSQLRFLFTNELNASGIEVLCSDQKIINISHEKIDIAIEIAIVFENRIKIDRNLKSRIVTTLRTFRSHAQNKCYVLHTHVVNWYIYVCRVRRCKIS